MRRSLFTLAFAAVCLVPSQAAAFDFKKERRPIQSLEYPITFEQGGKVQTGSVYYRIYMMLDLKQRGSGPGTRKLIDNRSCQWRVTTNVDREVCFDTVMGRRSCQNELSYRLPYDRIARHTRGNLLEYKPCKEFVEHVHDVADATAPRIMNDRVSILNHDLEEMRKLLPKTRVNIDYRRGRLVYPKPTSDAFVANADLPKMTSAARHDGFLDYTFEPVEVKRAARAVASR